MIAEGNMHGSQAQASRTPFQEVRLTCGSQFIVTVAAFIVTLINCRRPALTGLKRTWRDVNGISVPEAGGGGRVLLHLS
jgi:hypothetical protein